MKLVTPPEGYEIDKDKSIFKEIVFKPIYLTYHTLCKELFSQDSEHSPSYAISREQMRKIHALNQLANIATYYNNRRLCDNNLYSIIYNAKSNRYSTCTLSSDANIYGTIVLFKSAKDAQAVINNFNFRTILDRVYK